MWTRVRFLIVVQAVEYMHSISQSRTSLGWPDRPRRVHVSDRRQSESGNCRRQCRSPALSRQLIGSRPKSQTEYSLEIILGHASSMLPLSLITLLSSLLSWLPSQNYLLSQSSSHRSSETVANTLVFELRHEHAVSSTAHVVLKDIPRRQSSLTGETFSVNTRQVKRTRPSSYESFVHARTQSRLFKEHLIIDWDEDEIEAPDVEHRNTLLTLAKMTNDAYLEPGEAGWYELGERWNIVSFRSHALSHGLIVLRPTVISLRVGARSRWFPRPRLRDA